MALINWTGKLSVGVEAIDARHSVLVETVNELHRAMMRGQAKNLTEPLLHNLVAYARGIFSAEEAMMAAANYPELAEHRARHRDLTKKVEGYVARFERGEIPSSLYLLNFLRDWLANHIEKEDRAFVPCLNAHGIW